MSTTLEDVLIGYIREFPKQEQLKIIDLFPRFSIPEGFSGEVKFYFQFSVTPNSTLRT